MGSLNFADFPEANATKKGLMSATIFNDITDLKETVESLSGGSETFTQEQYDALMAILN